MMWPRDIYGFLTCLDICPLFGDLAGLICAPNLADRRLEASLNGLTQMHSKPGDQTPYNRFITTGR